MKITETLIRNIYINEVKGLDPINVILEDTAVKQGRVIIECYGQSWTTYWGSMWEGLTVAQFFCAASEDYVIDRLWPGGKQHSVPDYQALDTKLKTEIISQRKKGALGKNTARRMFDACKYANYPAVGEQPDKVITDLITEILDYCWWDHIPQKINDEYVYLKRIVITVREALSIIDKKVTT